MTTLKMKNILIKLRTLLIKLRFDDSDVKPRHYLFPPPQKKIIKKYRKNT